MIISNINEVCWDAVLLWIQWTKAVREGKLSPWTWDKVAKENGFIDKTQYSGMSDIELTRGL